MVHVAAASGAFTAASGAIGMAGDDEEFAKFWVSLMMMDLPTDFTAASATARALSGLQLTDCVPEQIAATVNEPSGTPSAAAPGASAQK